MASATATQRTTTISDGLGYRVAEHRILVKKRASGGEGETVFEAQSPAGGAVPSYRQADCDESFLVLDGSYSFEINGVRAELGAGSCVFVPRGTPHAFRNTSRATARMLVMLSPGARPGTFFGRLAIPELFAVAAQTVAEHRMAV